MEHLRLIGVLDECLLLATELPALASELAGREPACRQHFFVHVVPQVHRLYFFFLLLPLPPRSTLFPYTTLFRSAPWSTSVITCCRTRSGGSAATRPSSSGRRAGGSGGRTRPPSGRCCGGCAWGRTCTTRRPT